MRVKILGWVFYLKLPISSHTSYVEKKKASEWKGFVNCYSMHKNNFIWILKILYKELWLYHLLISLSVTNLLCLWHWDWDSTTIFVYQLLVKNLPIKGTRGRLEGWKGWNNILLFLLLASVITLPPLKIQARKENMSQTYL